MLLIFVWSLSIKDNPWRLHSKGMCHHTVFAQSKQTNLSFGVMQKQKKNCFSSNCIKFVCCCFGSLTCIANGKPKHKIACLLSTRLFFSTLKLPRHTRNLHDFFSCLHLLNTNEKEGNPKLTCYFRIHKSLLVRWMCLQFFSVCCLTRAFEKR